MLLNDAGIKPDLINFGLGLLLFEKIKDFTALRRKVYWHIVKYKAIMKRKKIR
jgi:hypothetical protein